ncbi:MAG TPA: putative metal-binding motif-containing protein [Polyangiales bacterium]
MTQRVLAIGLILVGLAAGCSLLTKPEQSQIRCEIFENDEDGNKIDPCPAGLYCLKGVCQLEDCDDASVELCANGKNNVDDDCDDKVDETNSPDREICDTRDNDCDEKIDEGFDSDGDEWTWCGTKGTQETGTFDCDPANKEANPDAKEVCDGIDNDCDENSDEEPSGTKLCDGSQECLNGQCEVPSCAVPASGIKCKANETCVEAKCVAQACSPACKATEFCDMPSLTCMPQPPKKAGDDCTVDADCVLGGVKLMCFERAALGLGAGPARGLCSISCCNDRDCGPNETCYVSGTGTRACLPKPYVNPISPARCTINQECSATMQACAIGVLGSDIATSVCRTRTGTSTTERKIGELCGTGTGNNNACESRMCIPGDLFQQLCTAPCQVSADCQPLKAPLDNQLGSGTPYCGYVDLGEFDSRYSRNFASICRVARAPELGSGRNGLECSSNFDCASGTCIGGSSEGKGRCADTCCTDSQCTPGAAGAPATRCRPVVRGLKRYEMRCLVQ